MRRNRNAILDERFATMSSMKNTKIRTLLIVNLVSFMGFQVFVPVYALFASDIGATPAQTGAHLELLFIMAIAVIILGKLKNNFNKEKVLILGYFLYSLGSFSFLLAASIASLILILSFNALISGLVFPAYKAVFGKSEDKGRESEEWAWFDSSTMLASAVGAGLGGAAIGAFGFNGLFIAMGVIQFIAALIAWRYLPIANSDFTDRKSITQTSNKR